MSDDLRDLRAALVDLTEAVERVGEGTRYWPREMRLDGTAEPLEAALDTALAALAVPVSDDRRGDLFTGATS